MKATETLAKFKKAGKLVRLYEHKMGPKSFKRGQGALLNALLKADGAAPQSELTKEMGINRSQLKDVVKKAKRNGLVTIEEAEGKKTYTVQLTDEGKEVAAKRVKSDEEVAEKIISCLTDEEIEQLNAISEKLIVAAKEEGICAKHMGRKHPKNCRRHGKGRKGRK